MKCFLIFIFSFLVLHTNFGGCGASTEVMKIEERASSVWDQLNALVRLPGDIIRRDYIGAAMDALILIEFLPLPFPIPTLISFIYTILKFIQPAYWWLFPSTKPPNIKGRGFQKLRG